MEDGSQQISFHSKVNFCVIIPTYNNCKTLERVVDSVAKETEEIIIVNDGSTDLTNEILKQYSQFTQIRFPKNKGKGMALRAGFRKALDLGYDYAITIDSDGQHFATDIPNFVAAIKENPETLFIGNRNMKQEGVPGKSSFGNTFSNFWFWFETGNRLKDTQSGFRSYPLSQLPKRFFTNKFEFEIEVIVRSAWSGIPVTNIPISILYDPKERVSHFRPFTDFTRISILNTVLVIIALFYIKPRDFFRTLKQKGVKKFFLENILESGDSDTKKALSIALGIFVGIAPFWGFQTILVLFLAVLFKLNKAIAFAFSNVSFPPFIPFIIFGSLQVGSLFFENKSPYVFGNEIALEDVKNNIAQYIVGSFILASLSAVIIGIIAYLMLLIFSRFKEKK